MPKISGWFYLSPNYNDNIDVVRAFFPILRKSTMKVLTMHDQSANVDSLWAKSCRNGMIDYMPLRAHMLDVGVAAQAILARLSHNRQKNLRETFGLNESELAGFVGTVAALHDIGKASPDFQLKWRDGQTARSGNFELPNSSRGSGIRHEVYSHVIVHDALAIRTLERRTVSTILDSIAVHHGIYPSGGDVLQATQNWRRWAPNNTSWALAHADLIARVYTSFGWIDPPPIYAIDDYRHGAAAVAMASIISAADWIGSSLPYTERIEEDEIWIQRRKGQIEELLDRLNWRLSNARGLSTYSDLFGTRDENGHAAFSPRPLQSTIARAISDCGEPILIIVEAPMGEGKTEAALYAAAHLCEHVGHEGLYVALPTMATSNQMYGRVQQYLERFLGQDEEGLLQLLHGSTILNEAYSSIIDVRSNTCEAIDVDASISASSWFTGSKKGFLTQFAVGTVDQALYGVLPVKHWFMRLYGLSNKTVVLDEVHAYDAYTGELIVKLVNWLLRMNSSVIIMSATLPAEIREKLEQARTKVLGDVSNKTIAQDMASYPRLTIANSKGVQRHSFLVSDQNQKQVQICSVSHEIESVASLLIENAGKGRCVVAIVNTVKRAQDLYLAVEGKWSLEPFLFHARMPGTWRSEREVKILSLFGPTGNRPERAIVIATQVVEQSLDVDFDVMYTDLAPIDLVLQRTGRLQRHPRPARTFEPILYIGGMEAILSDPKTMEVGCGRVYERYPMLHSVAALQGRNHFSLPADIDVLVQRVYGSELIASEGVTKDTLLEARTDYEKKVADGIHKAFAAATEGDSEGRPLRVTSQFLKLEEGDKGAGVDTTARTRLGDTSMRILPFTAEGEGGRRLLIDGRPLDLSTKAGIIDALKTTFTISHPGLIREILQTSDTGSIAERLAELRGCHGLLFVNGATVVGNRTIRLDPKLGVVFE